MCIRDSTFTNVPGYFGVDRPTFVQEPLASTVPGSPFLLLDGAGGGLYIGIDAPEPELLTWVAELEPGYSDSMGSQVPTGPSIGGKEVRVEVSTVHLPFVMPGERRTLPPVRAVSYTHLDVYKRQAMSWPWFSTSSTPP